MYYNTKHLKKNPVIAPISVGQKYKNNMDRNSTEVEHLKLESYYKQNISGLFKSGNNGV